MGPLSFLNDASVHIGDVHCAIGRGGHIDRAEQRISRAQKLRLLFLKNVVQGGQSLRYHRVDLTHDTSHWFAIEILAFNIGRESVATVYIVTRRTCNAIERAIRLANFVHTTLHVGGFHGCTPGYVKTFGKFIGDFKISVMNRKLEMRRQAAGPTLEPQFAVVVVGKAPLGAVGTRFFPNDPLWRFTNAEGIDSAIEPVIHAIIHEGLLVFYVARAAVFAGKKFFFVGFSIAVCIGVFVDIVGIGFH